MSIQEQLSALTREMEFLVNGAGYIDSGTVLVWVEEIRKLLLSLSNGED